MIEQIRRERCKSVTTVDTKGAPNGSLVELFKDGAKTLLYLTATHPTAFKGYHLHTVRSSHYVVLKGTMKITVVEGTRKVEHTLSAENPERLFVPTNVWIGLQNIGDDEAWLVNFPSPPYDPQLKDEQQEKTPEEIAKQLGESRVVSQTS